MVIEYTPKFRKSIKHIKNKDIKGRIKRLIEKLVNEPSDKHYLKHKKREQKVYVGKYRLLYSYEGDTLHLIDFDRRERVYKKGK